MTNSFITNKKQTAAAIKAAEDQAENVKKENARREAVGNSMLLTMYAEEKQKIDEEIIKARNEKRNELEFQALLNWKKDFEKRWLK